MGRKSARKGKHILLLSACFLAYLGVSMSCSPRTNRWIDNYYFGRADSMVARGDFDEALKENAAILEKFPDTLGDQALYNMGLIYIHPENTAGDDRKALDVFQKILREYPKSPLREEVQVWILTILKMRETKDDLRDVKGTLALLEKDLMEDREKTRRLKDAITRKDGQLEELRRSVSAGRKRIEELELQVSDLQSRIQKLKKVDLGIEERKRKVLR